MKKMISAITLMCVCFIIFEITLYISFSEKFVALERKLSTVNIEIEELRKTQRLISQDADYALRLAVEAGATDED